MPLQLLPVTLWQTVPFGDPDAFLDWNLPHFLAHMELAKKTFTEWMLLDTLREDPFPHALLHRDLSAKLGKEVNLDFAGYDLNDRDSYYQFMTAHAAHHSELASAVGL